MSKKLTEKDIFEAGTNAKCCRHGTLEATQCDRCGRIVFIAPKGTAPEEIAPGVEKYGFVIRSRCTSSREHLHSALVLWLDQLPTQRPVLSKSFVVHARIKKSKKAETAAAAAAALAMKTAATTATGAVATTKTTMTGYRSDETTGRAYRPGLRSCASFGGYSSSGYQSGYSST
jgi:hypothetical protein